MLKNVLHNFQNFSRTTCKDNNETPSWITFLSTRSSKVFPTVDKGSSLPWTNSSQGQVFQQQLLVSKHLFGSLKSENKNKSIQLSTNFNNYNSNILTYSFESFWIFPVEGKVIDILTYENNFYPRHASLKQTSTNTKN